MGHMSKKKQGKRAKHTAQEVKPFVFEDRYDLAVVGGGAAGLACALSCAQEARRFGGRMPRIIVLEKGRRIGSSILRSGNGRCNFSNSQLQVGQYHNGHFAERSLRELAGKAERLLSLGSGGFAGAGSLGSSASHDSAGRFPLESSLAVPAVRWFEQLGLVWEEAAGTDGLLYPFSNKASSVLEVLVSALQQFNVDLRVCVDVDAIGGAAGGFELSLSQVVLPQSGQAKRASSAGGTGQGGLCKAGAADSPSAQRARIRAARVAFAPGGGFDAAILAGVGLDCLEPWQPVLGPLAVRFPDRVRAERLDGIRVRAHVSVPETGFSEFGEVLFREYGVSGIVVFNASRSVVAGAKLCLDFLPGLSVEDAEALLARRAQQFAGEGSMALFRGFLLPELAEAVCAAAGVNPASAAGEEGIRLLAETLKCFCCTMEGIADERQCQVHRGGVPVGTVHPATMECGGAPGFYVLGEALDVDGPCGGYNLHWAWSSGMLAGFDMARFFAEGKRC